MTSESRGGWARLLIANTVITFAGQILLLIVVFFSTPYIVGHLGNSLYGTLVLVVAYVEGLRLVGLGANTALVKYLAELLPQGRRDDIQHYFGTALSLFLTAGVAIAGGVTLLAPWVVQRFVHAGSVAPRDLVEAFWLASAAFLLRFVGQVFAAVPVAAERFDVSTGIGVGQEVCRIAGSVIALACGYFLKGVLIAMVAANLLGLVAAMVAARRLLPRLVLVPGFSLPHLRSILRFSAYVWVSDVSGRIVDSADVGILGYFLPPAFVAFYAIPCSIGRRAWTLLGNLAAVVFPAGSALGGAGDAVRLRKLYLRASKYMVLLALAPVIALWVYGGPFLAGWVGTDYARQGTWALRLLILGFAVNAVASVPYTLLQSVGEVRTTARFCILYAVLNVGMFALLIPHFEIDGAAAGFLVAQAIADVALVGICNRRLGVGTRTYLEGACAPALVPAASSVLVAALLAHRATSLISVVLLVGVCLAAHLGAGLFFTLDDGERALLRAFAGDRLAACLPAGMARSVPSDGRRS